METIEDQQLVRHTTAIDPIYMTIVDISKGSNEAINQFENTPIYDLLRKRREIARIITSRSFSKESQEVEALIICNNEIKKYLRL